MPRHRYRHDQMPDGWSRKHWTPAQWDAAFRGEFLRMNDAALEALRVACTDDPEGARWLPEVRAEQQRRADQWIEDVLPFGPTTL